MVTSGTNFWGDKTPCHYMTNAWAQFLKIALSEETTRQHCTCVQHRWQPIKCGVLISQHIMDEVQRKLSAAEHHRPSSEPHRTKQQIYHLPKVSRPALESTKLPTQWLPVAIPKGVKWPDNKANHSPSSSTKA